MKLKFVRSPGECFSGHIYLYAWSDSPSDFYLNKNDDLSNNRRVYAIKFDYYPRVGYLEMNDLTLEAKDIHSSKLMGENDESVILDSPVSFSYFCRMLLESPFASSYNYSLSFRNCIDSAVLALKIAELDVFDKEVNAAKCKHIIACFWARTQRITPRELFKLLKNLKKMHVKIGKIHPFWKCEPVRCRTLSCATYLANCAFTYNNRDKKILSLEEILTHLCNSSRFFIFQYAGRCLILLFLAMARSPPAPCALLALNNNIKQQPACSVPTHFLLCLHWRRSKLVCQNNKRFKASKAQGAGGDREISYCSDRLARNY